MAKAQNFEVSRAGYAVPNTTHGRVCLSLIFKFNNKEVGVFFRLGTLPADTEYWFMTKQADTWVEGIRGLNNATLDSMIAAARPYDWYAPAALARYKKAPTGVSA